MNIYILPQFTWAHLSINFIAINDFWNIFEIKFYFGCDSFGSGLN